MILAAGGSSLVEIKVTPPPAGPWTAKLWPIYMGFLVAHNNYETYTVPYAGMNSKKSPSHDPILTGYSGRLTVC